MSDLISRQAAIDAIEGTDWYHQNANKDMVSGAKDEHQAWYKAEDVYKALESVPSAQPEAVEEAKNVVLSVIKSEPHWTPCSEELPKRR